MLKIKINVTEPVQTMHAALNKLEELIELIEKFHYGEREKLKESINPILGKFTPKQWAIGQYKHLDHHLRQLDV